MFPDLPHLARELDVAVEAARLGGAEVMARYGSTEAVAKPGGSPVTEADYAACTAILDRIRHEFPDDAILCEESVDDLGRLRRDRLWVVDPLDGTKEFLARNGEFSIMIGLVVGGSPVLGVVYRPDGDVLFAGVPGAGAWRVHGGETGRLRVRPANGPPRLVTSRSHADARVEAVAAQLRVADRRPSGSVGLKCALIASGEADVYVHPVSYMSEWDTCAPEAVLRAAGGQVSDCRGRPLQYNKADPRQRHGIIACVPGLLGRAVAAVAAAGVELPD